MPDSLRKSVIEIDWRVNNDGLIYANRETDKIISKAGKVEQTYGKTDTAINKSSGSLRKHNTAFREGVDGVNKYGDSSKKAFQDTEDSAKSARSTVVHMERATDDVRSSSEDYGTGAKKAFEKVQDSAKDTREDVQSVEKSTDSAKDSSSRFGSTFKSSMDLAKSSTKGLMKQVDTLSDRVTKVMGGAFRIVRNTVMGAGALALGGGILSFNAASDFNESLNKVNVAFDTSSETVKDWSENTLENFGLAQGTALDLASTFGDMSTSMGLSDEEAASMSTSMVGLAGDLSSFKNIDIDRAYTALNGVFTGETEALKSLGVVMTQTNLEQFALSQGFTKSIKEMSQAEQVQLRYAYVMDKTKNAQGDFANTSDQAANASRVFKESAKELSATFGQVLLPMFTPVIQMGTRVIQSFDKYMPGIKKALDPLQPYIESGIGWVEGQFGRIPEAIGAAAEFIEPAIEPGKKALKGAKDFLLDDFLPTMQNLATTMGPGFLEGAVETFEVVGWIVDNALKPALGWLKEYSEEHPGRMESFAKASGIGMLSLMGYSKTKGIITGVTTVVGFLIKAIEKIGPAASKNATLANESLGGVGATGGASGTGKKTFMGSLKNAGGKITSGSKGAAGWVKNGGLKSVGSWLVRGSSATKGGAMLNAGSVAANGSFSLGRSLATGAKSTGSFLKNTGKSIPGLSYLFAGANLIGMNKENAGNKLGGSAGMLAGGSAGAALGASLGSVVPGIGTAIGGALGGIIGTMAGTRVGTSMGESIQKNWKSWTDATSKFAEEHPILGSPIRWAENYIESVKGALGKTKNFFSDIYEGAKEKFADPLEVNLKADLLEDGIDEETAKAVNQYMQGEYDLDANRLAQNATGAKQSEEDFDNTLSARDEQKNTIVAALDEKEAASGKNINILQTAGVIDAADATSAINSADELNRIRVKNAEKANEELKALEKARYEEQLAVTKRYEERINGIKQTAKDEGKALTKEQLDEIERLEALSAEERRGVYAKYEPEITKIQNDQRENAVQALSSSAEEQKIIMGRLADNTETLSAKQAADIVKNSLSAKEGAIEAANAKYEEVIAAAEHEFYVSGTISKEQFEEIKANAENQRDSAVQSAEEMHSGVVEQAKLQAEGQLNQVDWATGESLTKWNRFVVDVAGVWNSITGMVNWVLGKLGVDSSIPEWTPKGYGNNTSTTSSAPKSRTVGSYTQMQYAGTNHYSGGPALVGEEGFELAYDKATSTARILGENGPEVTELSPGSKILNHRDSMKVMNGGLGSGKVLPGFASGTSKIGEFVSDAWSGVKEVGENILSGASAIWDWVSNPVEKMTELIGQQSPYSENSGNTMMSFGAGVIKTLGNGAKEWITDKLSGLFAPSTADSFGGSFAKTSGFGRRVSPGGIGSTNHQGVDYAAPVGTPIPSQSTGVVSAEGYHSVRGNYVKVRSGQFDYLYQHNSKNLVDTGDGVTKGQIIALVGSTGSSTGSHLHYEVHSKGVPVNPEGGTSFSKAVKAYAKGGRPPINETVLVGEKGPELVEMDKPGTVHPYEKTKALINQHQASSKVQNVEFKPDITVNVGGDGSNITKEDVKKAVDEALNAAFESFRRQFDTGVAY